jgi:hypothetical protein
LERGRFSFAEEREMETERLSGEEFLARFEAGGFGAREYGHREHVRTVWLYLQRLEAAEVVVAIARGIHKLAEAHGSPGLYHETLTRVWVHLIAEAYGRAPSGQGFDSFLGAIPELLDRELPYRYYSRERLTSAAARAEWMPPDLRPLPGSRELGTSRPVALRIPSGG